MTPRGSVRSLVSHASLHAQTPIGHAHASAKVIVVMQVGIARLFATLRQGTDTFTHAHMRASNEARAQLHVGRGSQDHRGVLNPIVIASRP